MDDKELIEKCDACEFNLDNDLVQNCKNILSHVNDYKGELDINDDEAETYLQMVENLKPADVSKVLQIAMKISSNNKIKDTELQRDASRLIRAIQMS
jgi:hypothetical protein